MKLNRRFVRAAAVITVIILVLGVSVATVFSWYNRSPRNDEEGKALNYTINGAINNTDKERTLYTVLGNNENGDITYKIVGDGTEEAVPSTEEVTIGAGEIAYFKTTVNKSNFGDSVASLYLSGLTSANNKAYIGIVSPEKTHKTQYFTASDNTYVACIEDNILIPNNKTVDVYWFINVDAESDSALTIDTANIYLAYN